MQGVAAGNGEGRFRPCLRLVAGAVAGLLDLLPGASDLEPEFLPGVALGHGQEAIGRLREFLEKRNLELREEQIDASVGASGERDVRELSAEGLACVPLFFHDKVVFRP